MSFVEHHGLWSAGQRAAAKRMLKEVDGHGIKAIRFSFADQHGILRGKTVAVGALSAALDNGVTITTTLLLKDTAHKTVYPAFTPGRASACRKWKAPRIS